MKWLKNKIRRWLGYDELDSKIYQLERKLSLNMKYLNAILDENKKFTTVDADIGYRGNNTIVLTGVYRGRGYVKFYDIGDEEFTEMVERLRHMKNYSLIRNIDKPYYNATGSFDIFEDLKGE